MSIYETHPNQIDAAHDADGEDPRPDWVETGLDAYDPYRELDHVAVAKVMDGREFQSTDPRRCRETYLDAFTLSRSRLGDELSWVEDCGDIDGVASMSRYSGFVIAVPPSCPEGHVVVEDIGGDWKLLDHTIDCLAKVTR